IQLRNFQDQFPLALTEMVGRQLFLTDFGKEIAIAADRILEEVNTINYKTIAFGGNLAGRLKIAVVSTGKYVMPYFLSGFMKANPGVDLTMDVTNKASVLNNLEQNEVDFALVSVLPKHFGVHKIGLLENRLYLVGSATETFGMTSVTLENLEKAPLIFRENGSATRMAMERFLNTNKIKISKRIELTSNEAVKQAVVAGLGYSIMPLIGIKNEMSNGALKIHPLPGLPIITKWNLIWMPTKKFSPVAQAFSDHLEAQKNVIAQREFQWVNDYFADSREAL
ncbi:MAG: LysR substrate-binding domain-containing protein, partial [Bacteroidota bacterium]